MFAKLSEFGGVSLIVLALAAVATIWIAALVGSATKRHRYRPV